MFIFVGVGFTCAESFEAQDRLRECIKPLHFVQLPSKVRLNLNPQ